MTHEAYGNRGYVCIPCSDGRHKTCLLDGKGQGSQCTCPCEDGKYYGPETDVGQLARKDDN